MTIQDVDKNLAESFGLDRPRGALVVQVAEDGPADKAGLAAGDVIITFDGNDIPASADLPHVVGLVAPDTVVPEIVRDTTAQIPEGEGRRPRGRRQPASRGGRAAQARVAAWAW